MAHSKEAFVKLEYQEHQLQSPFGAGQTEDEDALLAGTKYMNGMFSSTQAKRKYLDCQSDKQAPIAGSSPRSNNFVSIPSLRNNVDDSFENTTSMLGPRKKQALPNSPALDYDDDLQYLGQTKSSSVTYERVYKPVSERSNRQHEVTDVLPIKKSHSVKAYTTSPNGSSRITAVNPSNNNGRGLEDTANATHNITDIISATVPKGKAPQLTFNHMPKIGNTNLVWNGFGPTAFSLNKIEDVPDSNDDVIELVISSRGIETAVNNEEPSRKRRKHRHSHRHGKSRRESRSIKTVDSPRVIEIESDSARDEHHKRKKPPHKPRHSYSTRHREPTQHAHAGTMHQRPLVEKYSTLAQDLFPDQILMKDQTSQPTIFNSLTSNNGDWELNGHGTLFSDEHLVRESSSETPTFHTDNQHRIGASFQGDSLSSHGANAAVLRSNQAEHRSRFSNKVIEVSDNSDDDNLTASMQRRLKQKIKHEFHDEDTEMVKKPADRFPAQKHDSTQLNTVRDSVRGTLIPSVEVNTSGTDAQSTSRQMSHSPSTTKSSHSSAKLEMDIEEASLIARAKENKAQRDAKEKQKHNDLVRQQDIEAKRNAAVHNHSFAAEIEQMRAVIAAKEKQRIYNLQREREGEAIRSATAEKKKALEKAEADAVAKKRQRLANIQREENKARVMREFDAENKRLVDEIEKLKAGKEDKEKARLDELQREREEEAEREAAAVQSAKLEQVIKAQEAAERAKVLKKQKLQDLQRGQKEKDEREAEAASVVDLEEAVKEAIIPASVEYAEMTQLLPDRVESFDRSTNYDTTEVKHELPLTNADLINQYSSVKEENIDNTPGSIILHNPGAKQHAGNRIRNYKLQRKFTAEEEQLILRQRKAKKTFVEIALAIEQLTGNKWSPNTIGSRHMRLTATTRPVTELNDEDHFIIGLRDQKKSFSEVAVALSERSGRDWSTKALWRRYQRLRPAAGNPAIHAEGPSQEPYDEESNMSDSQSPSAQHMTEQVLARPTTGGKTISPAMLSAMEDSDFDGVLSDEDDEYATSSRKLKSHFDDTPQNKEDLCHWAYFVKRTTWTTDQSEGEGDSHYCGGSHSSLANANSAAIKFLRPQNEQTSIGSVVSLIYNFNKDGMAINLLEGTERNVRTTVERSLHTFQEGILPDTKVGWLRKKVYDVYFSIQHVDTDTSIPSSYIGSPGTYEQPTAENAHANDAPDPVATEAEKNFEVEAFSLALEEFFSKDDNRAEDVEDNIAEAELQQAPAPTAIMMAPVSQEVEVSQQRTDQQSQDSVVAPSQTNNNGPPPSLATPTSIYTTLDRANRAAANFYLAKQDAMTSDRVKRRYDYVIGKASEESRVRAICDSLEFDIGEAEKEGEEVDGKFCFDETFRVGGEEVRVWAWERGLEAPRNI